MVSTTKAAYKVFVLWCLLIAGIGPSTSGHPGQNHPLHDLGPVLCLRSDLRADLVSFPADYEKPLLHHLPHLQLDHLMMFSPLIFVGGFYAGSLVLMAAIAWLVWELCVMMYPERFWTTPMRPSNVPSAPTNSAPSIATNSAPDPFRTKTSLHGHCLHREVSLFVPFYSSIETVKTTTPSTTKITPVARLRVLGSALLAKTAATRAHTKVKITHRMNTRPSGLPTMAKCEMARSRR